MTPVKDLIEGWRTEQDRRATLLRVEPLGELPRFIAGADCAFSSDGSRIFVCALVWDRIEDCVVEQVDLVRPLDVPYVPTFLSFREGPALREAIESLRLPFGAILFDGQGIAHPRRCGIATHLGVELTIPTVGVAKSRLIGTFTDPHMDRGSSSPLMHRSEHVGVVLRTRNGIRPVFVSVGNRIDLESSVRLVLACVTRYRLPEPTRLADKLVAQAKKTRA